MAMQYEAALSFESILFLKPKWCRYLPLIWYNKIEVVSAEVCGGPVFAAQKNIFFRLVFPSTILIRSHLF